MALRSIPRSATPLSLLVGGLAAVACSLISPAPEDAFNEAPLELETPTIAAGSAPASTKIAITPEPPRAEATRKPALYLGAASRSACDVDAGGDMRCWGNNDHGQLGGGDAGKPRLEPALVVDLPPVAQAALGAGHTCALFRDGAVRCWGDDAALFGAVSENRRIDVKGLGEVTELIAGSAYSCALNADHAVLCWGRIPGTNEEVPASSPRRIPDLTATKLAGSSRALCALRTTGAIACFGENWQHSIIPQGPEQIERPTDVQKVESPIDVAMSDDGTCAIQGDGEVVCWGDKHFSAYDPQSVYGVKDAVSITGGGAGHFCALTRSGRIMCWGESSTGASGAGRYDYRADIEGSFTEVRAGLDFTCARATDGEVKCWGTNTCGQLAQDFEPAVARPTRLGSMTGARRIAASRDGTCVVLADQSILCFGPDPRQDHPDDAGPQRFETIMRSDDLIMSRGFERPSGAEPRPDYVVCAFTDALPTCWGNNRASHLPTQDAVIIDRPSTLSSMRSAKAYAFGSEHACSLSDDGSVRCWGGLKKTRVLPTKVKGVSGAAAIALGADEGCALLDDGTASCWPLRDPPSIGGPVRFAASRVMGVRGVVSIAHGGRHACAVDVRGGVVCWGLGEGVGAAPSASSGPAASKVEGLDGAVELALGDDFSCARRVDGSVSCWGKNDRGQLGDGGFQGRSSPSPVVDLADVTSLRAGASHVCALTKKGEVMCWGDNRLRVIEQGSPLVARSPMTVKLRARPVDAPKGSPVSL